MYYSHVLAITYDDQITKKKRYEGSILLQQHQSHFVKILGFD